MPSVQLSTADVQLQATLSPHKSPVFGKIRFIYLFLSGKCYRLSPQGEMIKENMFNDYVKAFLYVKPPFITS